MAGVIGARPGQDTGPPTWLIAGFFFGAIALGLAASVAGGDKLGAAPLLVVLFMFVPIWMFLTDRPAHALAVLLLYMGLLDGFLKLKVSSGNELPTIGRDVLLYSIAIGMLARAIIRRQPIALPPLSAWVFLWVAVVLVQLLNPDSHSLVHSVASTRQHLEFVPLFFIGYNVIRTRKRLRVFLVLLLVVAAANGIVSLVQWNLAPEQLAGWGAGYRDLIEGDGEQLGPRTAEAADGGKRTRPMALGSDMGFGGAVGGLAIPAVFALLAAVGWRRRHNLLAGALGLGAVIGVATCQSRTQVVGAVVCLAAFAAIGLSARRAPKLIGAIVLVGVISTIALGQIGGSMEGAFSRYESITPGKAVDTTIASRRAVWEDVPAYAAHLPFGAGLGSVGPAAGAIDSPGPARYNAETQFTFTIVEVGVPGLLILLAFHLHLFCRVVPRIRRLADNNLRLMLAALVAPLFMFTSNWLVGATTPSSPGGPFLWFAAGVLLWWTRDPDQRLAEPRPSLSMTARPPTRELSYSH
jgi:O-Antigen ligase